MNTDSDFSEKHPIINLIIGFIVLIVLVIIGILTVQFVFDKAIGISKKLLKQLSAQDAVVIVAVITGGVSIITVVISTIVGKVLEYRNTRMEYLTRKREDTYKQFVTFVQRIAEDTDGTRYPKTVKDNDLNQFSKMLTLWGSKRVVKKWNEYQITINRGQTYSKEQLGLLEEVVNAMRKDIGVGKVKKEYLSQILTRRRLEQ